MENLTPCGASIAELANQIPQNLKENLAVCTQCIKVSICNYAKSISLKMLKESLDEQSQPQQTNLTKNLLTLARSSMTFSDFHEKAQDV